MSCAPESLLSAGHIKLSNIHDSPGGSAGAIQPIHPLYCAAAAAAATNGPCHFRYAVRCSPLRVLTYTHTHTIY